MNANTETRGPPSLPMPTSPAVQSRVAQKRLVQRLAGHTTNALWLPEALHDGLDELRAEHRRLCARLAGELDALNALARRFKTEDDQFAARLRDAFRAKATTPPADDRTPVEERGAQRAKAEERLWGVAEVLADHADEVVAWMRRHEPELLGELKAEVEAADVRRREAEQRLAEAMGAAYRAHLQGAWIQHTADDLTGRQPVPTPSRAPAQVVLPAASLSRPWHKVRDWAETKATVAA